MVKNPPASAGDAGSIPGQEDSLEKEMATHFGILAWEIPQTVETGGLQSMGLQKSQSHLSTCVRAHTLGNTLGTSLAVQGLRLHVSPAGGPACHAAQPKKKGNTLYQALLFSAINRHKGLEGNSNADVWFIQNH